jgi:hypothetical protein
MGENSIATLVAGVGLSVFTLGTAQAQPQDLTNRSEPPMLGIVLPNDVNTRQSLTAAATSPLMTYHGGKIMQTVVSKSIFWGSKWAMSGFAGDKITGLDAWYTGHSDSNYAATSDEYTGTNGQVGSTGFIHQGHVIDVSLARGGGSTQVILNEVCKQITNGNIVPDLNGNGYYPVYSTVKRGNASYCAYHSAGSCTYQGQSVPVQFAFFWNLDGDASCDPQDTQTGHSQGLAALANVTAHELAEARTDPSTPGAWYDSAGNENGDKCAWTFNVPYVTFPDGNTWKLQGEWSNAAYTAGTGYPNSSSQKGCLDGR